MWAYATGSMVVESIQYGPHFEKSLYGGFGGICGSMRGIINLFFGRWERFVGSVSSGFVVSLSTLDPACQDKLRRHSLQTSRNLNQVSRAHDAFCSPPSEGPFIFAALLVGPPCFVLFCFVLFCFVKKSNNLAVFSRNLLKSLEALSQPKWVPIASALHKSTLICPGCICTRRVPCTRL